MINWNQRVLHNLGSCKIFLSITIPIFFLKQTLNSVFEGRSVSIFAREEKQKF